MTAKCSAAMFMHASRSASLRDMDQLHQLFGNLFMTARDPATLDTHGHLVAMQGRTDLLAWLVMRGIDLDATNAVGNSCIHEAATNGHIDTVLWLMQHGSNVFAINSSGESAFDLASQFNFDHAATLRNYLRHTQDSNQLWDCTDDVGANQHDPPMEEPKENAIKHLQDVLVRALVRRKVTEPTYGLEILELYCPETLSTVRLALDLSPSELAVAMASNAKLILAHRAHSSSDNQLDL